MMDQLDPEGYVSACVHSSRSTTENDDSIFSYCLTFSFWFSDRNEFGRKIERRIVLPSWKQMSQIRRKLTVNNKMHE